MERVAGSYTGMKRLFLISLAFLFCPVLVLAEDTYQNTRLGYSIVIPDGFVGMGESANSDGQNFAPPGRPISLSVWGGLLGDFDGEVTDRMAQDAADGWNQTYQAITPRWASWSAISGGQILYQRMIVLCDGQSYAAFRAEYGKRDRAEMDPIVEQMVASLRGDAC